MIDLQYLRQINDFGCGATSKKTARDLFNNIGIKIQFSSKKEAGKIPFEFVCVITDYNSVDVIQNYSTDSLFLQKTIVGWLVNDSTTHYSVVMNLFLPFSHPVSAAGPAWVQITTQSSLL